MYTRSVALATALAFGGCSFFYVRGPGDVGDPPARYSPCTSESSYPWIDAVVGALIALSATAAVAGTDHTGESASLFIWPLVFGASAIYGFTRESACDEHHVAWARAHPESPNGPVPLYYPPPQQPYGYPPPMNPAGTEGNVCAPNGGCNPGLVCGSGLCVRPPPQQPMNPAGTEGNVCAPPNNACNPGLTCASGLCVRPPTR